MKKFLKKIHLWLSIPFGIIFCLLCLTGAILVYEDELLELFHPSRYKVTEVGEKPLLLDELFEVVSENAPEGVRLSGISISNNPARTYQFRAGRKSYLYVDPYTGQITGTRQVADQPDFFMWTMRLHRWLLMPMKRDAFNLGKFITGWTTLFSLFILITGIIIWIPKTLKQLKKHTRIKTGRGRFRFWYDFHLVGGIYSAILLILLCVTGLTWSFSWWRTAFYAVAGVKLEAGGGHGHRGEDREKKPDTPNKYITWQKALDNIRKIRPNADRVSINDGSISVASKGVSGRFSDRYTFDEQTGEITDTMLYKDNQTPRSKVMKFIITVHFGTWLGQFSKFITCLAALIGAALPISGYYLWLKRKKVF